MSWLMAAVYDHVMQSAEAACLTAWRKDLLSSANGAVLELGAGTGANLAFYPPAVTNVTLVEPDPHMRRKLEMARRRAPSPERFEVVPGDAGALGFNEASFDTVVSTLVLCTVPAPRRALAEVARVLRPEGQLLYLEHVGAPLGTWRRPVQLRIEPIR
jgi:ubiquinone/menaquinone biosynthesis C-methylase UbiE